MHMRICFAALATLMPVVAAAQQPPEFRFGVHASYIGNDAGTGSDFDASARSEGFGLLAFTPNIALEIGASASRKTEDSGADNQGTYKIGITSNDVFAGLRLDTPAMRGIHLYGRGGLLYYDSKIDFREDFFGIKPGGSLERTESGTGYYVEGGVTLPLTSHLTLDAGISYRVRQDYFGNSSRPFDMTETGFGIGVVFGR